MDISEIRYLFSMQRDHSQFLKKESANDRIKKLKLLKRVVIERSDEICEAVNKDFNKNRTETIITEIIPLISEINAVSKHLEEWMRPLNVRTPLIQFGKKSSVYYLPKGQVLIISPWNYPFNLSMIPLVDAVAAGNSIMLKTSSLVPHTSNVIREIISKVFSKGEVAFINCDHATLGELLDLPFNHIFFTGGGSFGRTVMEKASKNLASVTLELGGKSPVVLHDSVDLDFAAKKIAWGKFINGGQTCIAPDYIFVPNRIAEEFRDKLLVEIKKMYERDKLDIKSSPDFCRVISEKHFDRLSKLVEELREDSRVTLTITGELDRTTRFIPPILALDAPEDSGIMSEEIFGPVLPILRYERIEEVVDFISKRDRPLALYIFSEDKRIVDTVLSGTVSGGVAINDTILHIANHNVPFGGVNGSGIGNYHGHYGFLAFSHERTVMRNKIDLIGRILPPPYNKFKSWAFKFLIKKFSGVF